MDHTNLTLRPFRPEDQERMLEMLTSNRINQTYMLPDFEKQQDAIPLFHRLKTLSEDSGRFVRCIDLEGSAIGFLNDVETTDSSIELGYVIHPEYHNRGYMTAALNWAITELFSMGYQEVICGAFEENQASIRVMEKCSMQQMEHTDTVKYRGIHHRCVYYHTINRKEN